MQRLFQFKIRTLLILISLIGLSAGYLAKVNKEYREETAQLAKMQEALTKAGLTYSLNNLNAGTLKAPSLVFS